MYLCPTLASLAGQHGDFAAQPAKAQAAQDIAAEEGATLVIAGQTSCNRITCLYCTCSLCVCVCLCLCVRAVSKKHGSWGVLVKSGDVAVEVPNLPQKVARSCKHVPWVVNAVALQGALQLSTPWPPKTIS